MQIGRNEWVRGSMLGDGAQGCVYETTWTATSRFPFPVVYKEFNPGVTVSPPALEWLTTFRAQAAPRASRFLDDHFTWPLSVVMDQGKVKGYLMRRIDPCFMIDLLAPGGKKRTLAELQLLKKPDHVFSVDHGFTVAWGARVELALELARIYDFLHTHRLIYGDLNWRNALWSVTSGPRMLLIDCDSLRRHGLAAPLPQLHSPQWVPPEGADCQTYETDLYKLALGILRLLSPGINAQVQGGEAGHFDLVKSKVANPTLLLFERALGGGRKGGSAKRPTAREWIDRLGQERSRAGRGKATPKNSGSGPSRPSGTTAQAPVQPQPSVKKVKPPKLPNRAKGPARRRGNQVTWLGWGVVVAAIILLGSGLLNWKGPPAEPEVGSLLVVQVAPDVELRFRRCPAGSVRLGRPGAERHVKFASDFWMGETEVTQREWNAVMQRDPSFFDEADADLPVDSVSWDEVNRFCALVNRTARIPPGWRLEVPTEDEWEYACRAGTRTRYHWGDAYEAGRENLDHEKGGTTSVRAFPPNSWGIHGMHGNVSEWCREAEAPERGVLRGGAWGYSAEFGTSWHRYLRAGNRVVPLFGFRAALVAR